MNRLATNSLKRSTSATRRALALLATATTAASLALSAAQASTAEWPYDIAYDDTEVTVAFEQNFPTPYAIDYGLSLELPADYFAAMTFPPMPDFGEEERPTMLAGLDPLQTP